MSGVMLVENMPDRILGLFQPEPHFHVAVKGFLNEWLICTDTELVIAKFGLAAGGPYMSSVTHIPLLNIQGMHEHSFALGFAGQFCVQSGFGCEGAEIAYLGLAAVKKFRMASEIVADRIELARQSAGGVDGVAREAGNSVAGGGMSFAEKERLICTAALTRKWSGRKAGE